MTVAATASTSLAVRAMLTAFGALGLDARRIQAEAGFTDEALADPDRIVPPDRFRRMWETADRAWSRPGLGLLAGAQLPFGTYEVLDYLLQSSATIGEGLSHFASAFAIATRATRFAVSAEADGTIAYVKTWRVAPEGILFHLRDYSLSGLTARVARAGGVRPRRVELDGPALAPLEEYERCLLAPVSIGAPRNALIFSRDAWDHAAVGRDDHLNRTLQRHAQLLLERQRDEPADGIAEQLRQELLDGPPAGAASLPVMARRLGMSERTLQRRLREAGTSFEGVCRGVRTSLAEKYLRDPALSVGEVAYLVGFSEPSAFSRAFRRWTGSSPQDFRAERVTSVEA
jgi:AraC-like DNA-binding protein